MTRDELRKIYTYLKKEVGIDGYPIRKLRTKEECEEAIRNLLHKIRKDIAEYYKEIRYENLELINEKDQLRKELENLKKRNWWRRLWNM